MSRPAPRSQVQVQEHKSLLDPNRLSAPEDVQILISALEAEGHDAWIVGGWIRDALLGIKSHDCDVCSSALWQESARILSKAGFNVYETGTDHGTISLKRKASEAPLIELTTYRVEAAYSDCRHPDRVRFVRSIDEDLLRRDFTINALAWHPERGLYDPFGGQEDLKSGLLRAVGEPSLRFSEDALRILRCLRFAVRFDLQIEKKTKDALKAQAPLLAQVSWERRGSELMHILSTGKTGELLRRYPEVIVEAFPQMKAMLGLDQQSRYHYLDVMEHSSKVLDACEIFSGGASTTLRLAALLHDIAKPACMSFDELGQGHFYGHPELGASMTRELLKKLAYPRNLIDDVVALIALHDVDVIASRNSVLRLLSRLDRLVDHRAEELITSLILLKRADAYAKARSCRAYAAELDQVAQLVHSCLKGGCVFRREDLALNGQELAEAAGVEPGPLLGQLIDSVLEAVIEGKLQNSPRALREFLKPRVQKQ